MKILLILINQSNIQVDLVLIFLLWIQIFGLIYLEYYMSDKRLLLFQVLSVSSKMPLVIFTYSLLWVSERKIEEIGFKFIFAFIMVTNLLFYTIIFIVAFKKYSARIPCIKKYFFLKYW